MPRPFDPDELETVAEAIGEGVEIVSVVADRAQADHRAALADAAKIDDLGFLAVFENFHVVGMKAADGITVLIGQTEVDLYTAVGVKMLEARISGGDFQARISRWH